MPVPRTNNSSVVRVQVIHMAGIEPPCHGVRRAQLIKGTDHQGKDVSIYGWVVDFVTLAAFFEFVNHVGDEVVLTKDDLGPIIYVGLSEDPTDGGTMQWMSGSSLNPN